MFFNSLKKLPELQIKKSREKRPTSPRRGCVNKGPSGFFYLGGQFESGERADRPRAILAMMRRQLRVTGAKLRAE
jgi:hypothetical protein